MAKTVRIDIPYSKTDDAIDLAQTIIAKHIELGANSPIPASIIAALQPLVAAADSKRDEAAVLRAQVETLMQEAGNAIGIGKGLTTNTPNTGLFYITQIRDILAGVYKGTEENLSQFGFHVVIS